MFSVTDEVYTHPIVPLSDLSIANADLVKRWYTTMRGKKGGLNERGLLNIITASMPIRADICDEYSAGLCVCFGHNPKVFTRHTFEDFDPFTLRCNFTFQTSIYDARLMQAGLEKTPHVLPSIFSSNGMFAHYVTVSNVLLEGFDEALDIWVERRRGNV